MPQIQISGIADEAGQDIQTQIRAHQELGWELIDLRAVDGAMITDLPDEKFDQVHAAIEESGLRVANFASGICCWGRSVRDDFNLDLNEMKRAIPRMQRMNCKTIRVMSCPHGQDKSVPEDEFKAKVIRRLKVLARMAEDAGLLLVHENAGGWAGSNPARQLEMLELVNSPSLQLLFDMGNFPNAEACWACFEQIRPFIYYLHIKDRTSEGCTYAGEGFIPVARILSDLVQHGYDGVASIEPHIAAMHHTGQTSSAKVLYPTYIRAGQAAAALVQQANAGD